MLIEVFIPEQRLRLLDDAGRALAVYAVSTALNGPGECKGSGCTPRGRHIVRARIGGGQPINSVFVGRRPTGEIWTPQLAAQFRDGSFANIYLSPKDYHRIHMPCAGRLSRMIHVPGELFSVNPTTARGVPGLFARIKAPFQETKDALLIPADAVSFDQLGNFVLIVKDKNVVERRQVEIGEQVGEMRVIRSGLTGNERVIVDGLLRAIPGREVTPEEAGKSAVAPPADSPSPKSAEGGRTGGAA